MVVLPLKQHLHIWKDEGYHVTDFGAETRWIRRMTTPTISRLWRGQYCRAGRPRNRHLRQRRRGAAIVANKFKGRAGRRSSAETYSAHQGVEHDES